MKISSIIYSSRIQKTIIMVVIYCYLERENYKVLKFHMGTTNTTLNLPEALIKGNTVFILSTLS